MKVLQINSMYINGSTGNICYHIEKELRRLKKGISKTIYFYGKKSDSLYSNKVGNIVYEKFIALISRITGKYGLLSHKMSKKVMLEIDKFKPDIIHLHNIHDHTLDIVILFNHLKKLNIPIVLFGLFMIVGHSLDTVVIILLIIVTDGMNIVITALFTRTIVGF